MKKGIIFDVDGTLWDACHVIADSWNECIEKTWPEVKSRTSESQIRALCGKTMDRFAAEVFPDEEKQRGLEMIDKCCAYEVDYLEDRGGRIYPDLEPTLKILKNAGYHLYIVSNCQLGYIEAFMNWSHTQEYFEDTECYGHTLRQKGENIKLVLQRNQLDWAVYLGDTQGDAEAARQAGIPFIHAAYGFGQVENAVQISGLKELPGLVEKL